MFSATNHLVAKLENLCMAMELEATAGKSKESSRHWINAD
jgi:hypothetical protein